MVPPIALMLPPQKSHLAFLVPALCNPSESFQGGQEGNLEKVFVVVVTSRTTVLKMGDSLQSHWALLSKRVCLEQYQSLCHPGHSLLLPLPQLSLCRPPSHGTLGLVFHGGCVRSTESHLPVPMSLVGWPVQITAGNWTRPVCSRDTYLVTAHPDLLQRETLEMFIILE